MRARRGDKPDPDLCSGPGKLTEALGIDLSDNEADLSQRALPADRRPRATPPPIVTGPRIGITKAVERPWRFCAAGNPFVSRPRPDLADAGPRKDGSTGARPDRSGEVPRPPSRR